MIIDTTDTPIIESRLRASSYRAQFTLDEIPYREFRRFSSPPLPPLTYTETPRKTKDALSARVEYTYQLTKVRVYHCQSPAVGNSHLHAALGDFGQEEVAHGMPGRLAIILLRRMSGKRRSSRQCRKTPTEASTRIASIASDGRWEQFDLKTAADLFNVYIVMNAGSICRVSACSRRLGASLPAAVKALRYKRRR